MVTVAVDPERQLVPLAFALIEGKKQRQLVLVHEARAAVCVGSLQASLYDIDRHHGLLNRVKEHMDGFPPLVHRWCMRHFAANMWRCQKKKELIGKLKLLCSVLTEKAFEENLQIWRRK